ncbi:MAG: MYG1 family protein [Verrucomicrobiota bacterium]
MTFSQILTHPGGSHKDEYLACCVLLAHSPAPIVRLEPTAADLADPTIAVVDVGGEHRPDLGNFDHHQFSKDHPPLCALSLVLQYLGVYEDALAFCDWLEPTEWLDTRGPQETSRWLGIERDTLAKLNSPIDVTQRHALGHCRGGRHVCQLSVQHPVARFESGRSPGKLD